MRIRIVFKRVCMRNPLLGSLILKHDAVASRQWSWRCLQGATETEATALLRIIHFPTHELSGRRGKCDRIRRLHMSMVPTCLPSRPLKPRNFRQDTSCGALGALPRGLIRLRGIVSSQSQPLFRQSIARLGPATRICAIRIVDQDTFGSV